jgi:hypothetical protein
MSYQSIVLGNGSAIVDDVELIGRSADELDTIDRIAYEPVKPVHPVSVADRLRLALSDHNHDKRALNRVIALCHNSETALPVSLVESRVGESIERQLRDRVESVLRA